MPNESMSAFEIAECQRAIERALMFENRSWRAKVTVETIPNLVADRASPASPLYASQLLHRQCWYIVMHRG